jgi:lysophospholipase L1-like esterase
MHWALPAVLAALVAAGAADETTWLNRGLVSAGSATRVQHFLAKARRGEPVTVSVIGGSITAGAKASRGELCYGALVAKWVGAAFPQSKVTFVNAGIGATGSGYGALRAQRDLLGHKPDLVVVEYAVNDPDNQQAAETLEGLLRQILGQPQQPAVMLLFMMNQAGGNAQKWHSKVGEHYELPMLSYRDALWPAMVAKEIAWTDFSPDEVHPNDRGHAFAARLVTDYLDRARAALPADDRLSPIAPQLPAPLLSATWDHCWLSEYADLKPVANHGFTYQTGRIGDAGWRAEEPGSSLEFEVHGTVLYLMDWRLRGSNGKLSVQVDDRAPSIHDTWFPGTWGGYHGLIELARDLPPGAHRVHIEVLAGKNPDSTGHQITIQGLGAAGVE